MPNVHGVLIDKKYTSKYIKISKIGAMLRLYFWLTCLVRGALNKDSIVWLDGTRPHLKYIIVQSDNTSGRLANFLWWKTPDVHDRFIDKKYISKYLKIRKIGAMIFLAGLAGQGVLN